MQNWSRALLPGLAWDSWEGPPCEPLKTLLEPYSVPLLRKNRNFTPLIMLWYSIGAITPTSILIFIALFDCGLQKLIYIDLMQVL